MKEGRESGESARACERRERDKKRDGVEKRGRERTTNQEGQDHNAPHEC